MIVKIGDEITVKVIEIDNMGRINLSRRALFQSQSDTTGAAGNAPPRERRPQQDSRPSRFTRPPGPK